MSLKKQVKKADWKTDKILATTSYHQQTGWADSIIENKKYVIYTRKDRKIICKCQYKNDQKVENKNVHFPRSIPQFVFP